MSGGVSPSPWVLSRLNVHGEVAVERIVGLDLRNPDLMAGLIAEVRPDLVLNAAAISGRETSAHDPEQAYADESVLAATVREL